MQPEDRTVQEQIPAEDEPIGEASLSREGQTPLMRQYFGVKRRHPDSILLFRMGDFYETFDADALTVSRVLGITLTKRANGKAADVALAGFPHHALDTYLPRLVRAGHRVAICEQLEDPKQARTIVKRDVVEIVTPGISFHEQLLSPTRSNYLVAAVPEGTRVGFAFIDVSTGEFGAAEVEQDRVDEVMLALAPSELLVRRGEQPPGDRWHRGVLKTEMDDWIFGLDFARETLLSHFGTHSLKGFGVDNLDSGLVAAGAILHYLNETQKGRLGHIRRIFQYSDQALMTLDPQTRRNLELVESMQPGARDASLVGILDCTCTAMGARMLRSWLVRPLTDVDAIIRRLDAVEALLEDRGLRATVRERLAEIGDLERLVARICTARAGPRDVSQIRAALEALPGVQELLNERPASALSDIGEGLDGLPDLAARIGACLSDDPPAAVGAGVVKAGFSPELDEVRKLASSGKDYLARLQKEESERTGISSLKVGFNKVFGYYLEVTNTHRDKVPDDFIRKQTLVNAERYITPALKEHEERILSAEETILQLEQNIFETLRATVAENAGPIQVNARLIAELDCYASLAEVAARLEYVRPTIDDSDVLEVVEGRHPVVEQSLPDGESFIPNDTYVSASERQILIITGPNMAGKSVVLRQLGLVVLLAQIGSFVPAKRARVGIVDRIFTRVGASDNLAAGESTFLVEMNEAANILNNATARSLVLLDEVGRGTSTFDGLSIAWALVEHLHESPRVRARTLFATHYHELNDLAEHFERIRNYRIQVREYEGRVIFLRKLVPGGADHSYGIEVARMAGLPDQVIVRAREILARLEGQHQVDAITYSDAVALGLVAEPRGQMGLFESDPVDRQLREEVESLDPEAMTPIDALLKLAELKKLTRPTEAS